MEQLNREYWNVLDHIPVHKRNQFLTMIEDYVSQLPKDDQILYRIHYLPVTKISMRMRGTLSGISKTEDQVLEDAVRELCVGVPEKRILRIIKILDKTFKYSEPRFFEIMMGIKSGRLRSDVCVPGSNCHYTREYLEQYVAEQTQISLNSGGYNHIILRLSSQRTYDHLSCTKVISPINLNTYTQMKILELVPGIVNTNKVIYCTLLADGFILGSYHTAVEDDFGQCAKLSLHNITPDLYYSLKKCVKIAIVNPYYKLGAADEFYLIRVDCPEEIIVMHCIGEFNRGDTNLINSSEENKTEGNGHFNAGDYIKATDCYTRAISVDASNPVYLSNRALCYLKRRLFESALLDAEAAVKLDPKAHKFQYRLAMAWSGLGDHEKSVYILGRIQGNSQSMKEVLTREKQLFDNSRGKFNFDKIIEQAKRDEEIVIADFLGPIIIDKSFKHGHGVFATRDINKGELITVHRAITYVGPNKGENLQDLWSEFFIYADHIAVSETRSQPKMYQCLTETITKSKLSAFRLFTLYTKHLNSDPISIQLYSSKGYELVREREKPPYQMEQIRTLLQKDSYAYFHVDYPFNKHMNTSGIWLIRAYLNHSCLPNTSLTFYKDVCVVHANTDIPKGVELTARRVPIIHNVEKRRDIVLDKWGYVCICELCEFESNPKNKNALARAILLRERADKMTDELYHPGFPTMQHIHFKLLNQAFSLANEMRLGPTLFNLAVWQAIHYLLSAIPKTKDQKKFLQVLYRAKSILCNGELDHQQALWKRWNAFNEDCEIAISDECINEVRENYRIFESYRTNVPSYTTPEHSKWYFPPQNYIRKNCMSKLFSE